MEYEVGDVVNSSTYSDNSAEDHRVVQILKDQWSKKYVIESLKSGYRCERSEYQISLSRNDPKRMNERCDCGARKIRHAAHVHWCTSLQDITKELKYL